MFTTNELNLFSLDYFTPILYGSDVYELESQNGDHWMILKQQSKLSKRQVQMGMSSSTSFMIYHRHANHDGFHYHAEVTSALEAVLEILQHDDYRMHRKGRTYFDEVAEKYA